ncbi:MAG: Zn-dependent hydrolase [Bacteroidetes bacterium HLUCCA01]|nr:MAG: Zn-dependent hydrolase [Bacteroidetes bacterium HLUCCA01]
MLSARFGEYTLYALEGDQFMLDGGAMFGVVPKPLWSRKIPADEQNRIAMCARLLLIHSHKTDRLYLIDTGMGTKFNAKLAEIYNLRQPSGTLQEQILKAGFSMNQVTDVIFTHLHFDHCGGASVWKDEKTSDILFPEANLWVTRSHWNTAIQPNMREKASFLRENLDPIARHPRLILTDGAHVFEDDFYTMVVNGHTTGMQLPVLEDGSRKLVYAADLLPTHAHAPVPWIMGYDMFPLISMEERNRLFARAVSESWLLFLEHDPTHQIIQLEHDGKNFSMAASLKLDEL